MSYDLRVNLRNAAIRQRNLLKMESEGVIVADPDIIPIDGLPYLNVLTRGINEKV